MGKKGKTKLAKIEIGVSYETLRTWLYDGVLPRPGHRDNILAYAARDLPPDQYLVVRDSMAKSYLGEKIV